MAAAKSKIRILPHRSVVIDGQAVGEGSVVSVAAKEAEVLVADGYATRELSGGNGKPAAKPKAKRRRPLDFGAAEHDPATLERGGDPDGIPFS